MAQMNLSTEETEGKRRSGRQRMRGLRGIPDTMDMNLSEHWELVKDREHWELVKDREHWELVKDREAGCAAVRAVAKIRTRLSN